MSRLLSLGPLSEFSFRFILSSSAKATRSRKKKKKKYYSTLLLTLFFYDTCVRIIQKELYNIYQYMLIEQENSI